MFMSEFYKIYFFKRFFNIYFLNVIFSVIPPYTSSICFLLVNNVYIEGKVSQIFIVGPSFYFMTKNGKSFDIIFNNIFNIA